MSKKLKIKSYPFHYALLLLPFALLPSAFFRLPASIECPESRIQHQASRIEYQVSSIRSVPINLLNQTTQSTNQLSDMPRHDYSSLYPPGPRTYILPLHNHNAARSDILAAAESTGAVLREYFSSFFFSPFRLGKAPIRA